MRADLNYTKESEKLKFLFTSHVRYLKYSSETNARALHEVRNILRDLIYASENVTVMRDALVNDSIEHLDRVMKEDLELVKQGKDSDYVNTPTMESPGWLNRYGTSIKSMFFFARGLQDAAYRLILEVNNLQTSTHSSMSDVLSDKRGDNPATKLLNNFIPEYFAWFKDFKAKRDLMKIGSPTSTMCTYSSREDFSDSLSFIFSPREKADIDLNYLTQVLKISGCLVDRVVTEALNANFIKIEKKEAA